MPYIDTKVSVSMSPSQEEQLKAAFGQAITTIPGKSEQRLMCCFEDECHLWFRGQADDPIAFVSVQVFGQEQPDAFSKMTGVLCQALEEVLGISPENVYVNYAGYANWGWNGSNF